MGIFKTGHNQILQYENMVDHLLFKNAKKKCIIKKREVRVKGQHILHCITAKKGNTHILLKYLHRHTHIHTVHTHRHKQMDHTTICK